MKFLLLLCLGISTACCGQKNNITVQLSKGTRSLYSYADQSFNDWSYLNYWDESFNLNSTNSIGSYGYPSLMGDKVKSDLFTFTMGVSNKKNTLRYNLVLNNEKNYFNDKGIRTANINLFTTAAEVNILYKKFNDKCKLYAASGIGITFIKRNYIKEKGARNNTILAFSISPVCFSYGNKYGFTVEPSLGYKGLLNIGGFYKF
jgi:hypothetical protein